MAPLARFLLAAFAVQYFFLGNYPTPPAPLSQKNNGPSLTVAFINTDVGNQLTWLFSRESKHEIADSDGKLKRASFPALIRCTEEALSPPQRFEHLLSKSTGRSDCRQSNAYTYITQRILWPTRKNLGASAEKSGTF